MCPLQGYGTLNGEPFYLRYRHDDAQLYVGSESEIMDRHNEGMPDLRAPRLYAEINDVTGDYDRGWLDDDEALTLLGRLIGLLKPVAEWNSTGHARLAATVEALVKMNTKNMPL